MTLPFGKFRGAALEDVPLSYLAWCIENVTNADPELMQAIRYEIATRLDVRPTPRCTRSLPAPEIADAANELIHAGYRALARRAHPDTGGTHDGMIAVQSARDWLRGALRHGVAA